MVGVLSPRRGGGRTRILLLMLCEAERAGGGRSCVCGGCGDCLGRPEEATERVARGCGTPFSQHIALKMEVVGLAVALWAPPGAA